MIFVSLPLVWVLASCQTSELTAPPNSAYCDAAVHIASVVTSACASSDAFVQPPLREEEGGGMQVQIWLIQNYGLSRAVLKEAASECFLPAGDFAFADCDAVAACYDGVGLTFPAAYPEPTPPDELIPTECGDMAVEPEAPDDDAND